jgi:hypothetical protein
VCGEADGTVPGNDGGKMRMAKMKFSFDSRKFENSIKKEMEKAIRKEQIAASVQMQPSVDGIKTLDRASEDMLKAILRVYDGNEELAVSSDYSIFPDYMRLSTSETFEKLKLSGIIGRVLFVLGGWSAYLTPNALTYFEDKKRYEERSKSMFVKLTANTKLLLDEILSSDNATSMLQERLSNATAKDEAILRKRIGDLAKYGLITVLWADDTVYELALNGSAYTYEEDLAEYEQEHHTAIAATYNINANQANVALDNAALNARQTNDSQEET